MHLLCLKATLDDIWLWHHKLRHARVYTLLKLVKYDLARGLPPYQYEKDHGCSACVKGK